jgi:hypothetical protein
MDVGDFAPVVEGGEMWRGYGTRQVARSLGYRGARRG